MVLITQVKLIPNEPPSCELILSATLLSHSIILNVRLLAANTANIELNCF
jgi:hypothetical protein